MAPCAGQGCGFFPAGCGGAPRRGARRAAVHVHAAVERGPLKERRLSRGNGGAGEARQLQNPHSSSGQTALYSGRPAGEGIPHAASLPLLFPTKPASLGFCGGPYRLRRKEKALFDGVKRKDAGGGIPGFARNARGACYGGFVLAMVVGSDLSTASDHRKSWGHFRMPSASLFAAAPWLLGVDWHLPVESAL